MNDRLHEIIAQCSVIHETNISAGIINDLDAIENKLSDIDSDLKEHYLKLLLQYYFQNNNLEGVQGLLVQGFKFEMRFDDVKEAFIHIKNQEENVIDFFEDNIVMLKDVIQDEDLKEMHDYYNDNINIQTHLDEPLELIKRNRYVCAHAYKSKNEFEKFFINEDLLDSLQRDMPFLLK